MAFSFTYVCTKTAHLILLLGGVLYRFFNSVGKNPYHISPQWWYETECSENASGGTRWKLSNFRTYFVCGCECGIFGCYELAHFLYWDLGSSKRTYQNIEALACDYSRLKTWSLCFYRCTHSVSFSTTNWDTKPQNDDAFSDRVKKGKTNIWVAKLPVEFFDHAQLNKLSSFNLFVSK